MSKIKSDPPSKNLQTSVSYCFALFLPMSVPWVYMMQPNGKIFVGLTLLAVLAACRIIIQCIFEFRKPVEGMCTWYVSCFNVRYVLFKIWILRWLCFFLFLWLYSIFLWRYSLFIYIALALFINNIGLNLAFAWKDNDYDASHALLVEVGVIEHVEGKPNLAE